MDSNLECTFKPKYLGNEISLGGFIPLLRYGHLGNKADAILRKIHQGKQHLQNKANESGI